MESILSLEACKQGVPSLEGLLMHPFFVDEVVVTVGIKPQLKVSKQVFSMSKRINIASMQENRYRMLLISNSKCCLLAVITLHRQNIFKSLSWMVLVFRFFHSWLKRGMARLTVALSMMLLTGSTYSFSERIWLSWDWNQKIITKKWLWLNAMCLWDWKCDYEQSFCTVGCRIVFRSASQSTFVVFTHQLTVQKIYTLFEHSCYLGVVGCRCILNKPQQC